MKKISKYAILTLSLSMVFHTAILPANAEETKTVTLGGQPFGVKFYNSGVLIIELESFESGGKTVCPAEEGGLKVNDIIKKVNDTAVKTNEELARAAYGSGGSPLRLTVERGGKELIKTVIPQKNSAGVYLTGAWVRDSCAGIGTVTYYDEEAGTFAALGHGICDRDTNALMPLGSAEVVKTGISSVTKSSAGTAGSLNGYFSDKKMGSLTKNTSCGVFGTINDNMCHGGIKLEIAENGELHVGKAEIYTTVTGEEAACFEAEITKLCDMSSETNENFVIKVTDKRLLDNCGGIVQGMSGSPVVQNGKLAGAVTHVFLNDPREGYGVTAQNMVSNSLE